MAFIGSGTQESASSDPPFLPPHAARRTAETRPPTANQMHATRPNEPNLHQPLWRENGGRMRGKSKQITTHNNNTTITICLLLKGVSQSTNQLSAQIVSSLRVASLRISSFSQSVIVIYNCILYCTVRGLPPTVI